MIKTIRNAVFGLVLACMLTLSLGAATSTNAPAPAKTWSLSVAGVGITGGESQFGNQWGWGGEVGLYRNLNTPILPSQLGVRQTVAYASGEVSSTSTSGGGICEGGPAVTTTKTEQKDVWTFRTDIAWDAELKLFGPVSLFAGPDFGVQYGDFTPTWSVGPEVGVKVKLSESVGIYTRANYDFSLNDKPNEVRFLTGLEFSF